MRFPWSVLAALAFIVLLFFPLPDPYGIINGIFIVGLFLFGVIYNPVRHLRFERKNPGRWQIQWYIFIQEISIFAVFYIILLTMSYSWVASITAAKIIVIILFILLAFGYSLAMSLNKRI